MNGTEFLLGVAEQALIHPEDYLKGGLNGPYVDNDTKVRCCAHWLITFCNCFRWTGKDRYREKVSELARFLCSSEARPFGYTFDCRDRRDNRCNGLIGTAWVIEALVEATNLLGNPKYANVAFDTVLLHPFDAHRGLWKRVEVDGRVFPIDCTFNHQLWFAACASMLLESPGATSTNSDNLRSQIGTFLDNIEDNIALYENGMIDHLIRGTAISSERPSLRRRLVRQVRILSQRRRRRWKYNDQTRFEQAAGYHAFSVYGFSLLRRHMQGHQFWGSPLFTRIVEHLLSDEHARNLESNRFGYGYNPIGFEIPFAVSSLTEMDRDTFVAFAEPWINKQLREHYNPKTTKMDKNTDDATTLTARLYELTRLEQDLLSRIRVFSASLVDT